MKLNGPACRVPHQAFQRSSAPLICACRVTFRVRHRPESTRSEWALLLTLTLNPNLIPNLDPNAKVEYCLYIQLESLSYAWEKVHVQTSVMNKPSVSRPAWGLGLGLGLGFGRASADSPGGPI